MTSDEMIERVARAIYDAPDSQSGDTVGTVIWNSEHLFYETKDGEEVAETARRVTMGVCRDAARAAITATEAGMGDAREALLHCRAFFQHATAQNTRAILAKIDAALAPPQESKDG
jgi:hypothetical protein